MLFWVCVNVLSFGQTTGFAEKIDSLIAAKTDKPFNGIVLIAQNGQTKYLKIHGLADINAKTSLKRDSPFVIGSISKQITAVLVLRELDKGHLALHIPIRQYLPELTQPWADTVTIHQLLTHTHGITELDKSLAFTPGTQYAYSQLGYELLGKIAEKTSGKSFAALSEELFEQCDMKNTFHPDSRKNRPLPKGYSAQPDGSLTFEKNSLENYVAAGSFVSTADDLVRWNQLLYNGKLLKPATYQQMITKQKNLVRQHPLFGKTEYGYGITVSGEGKSVQLGQTGYAPGFVS